MGTLIYKIDNIYSSLNLRRFYAGKNNGTRAQLTVGDNYITLSPEDMRKLATKLNEIADYAEGKCIVQPKYDGDRNRYQND